MNRFRGPSVALGALGLAVMLAGAVVMPWRGLEADSPTLLGHVVVLGQLLLAFTGLVALSQDARSWRPGRWGALFGVTVAGLAWVVTTDVARAEAFALDRDALARLVLGQRLVLVGAVVAAGGLGLGMLGRRRPDRPGLRAIVATAAVNCLFVALATLAWEPTHDRPLAVTTRTHVPVPAAVSNAMDAPNRRP